MKRLAEVESKKLVAGQAIGVPPGLEVEGADRAVDAARQVGFPVVVKISQPGLIHKTELGGVAAGLATPTAVRRAALELLDRAEKAFGKRSSGRLLVEHQVSGDVEMIAGLKRDPVFGPVLMVGMGGVFAEVLADTSVRLCPIEPKEALDMLRQLEGWPILTGFRSRPPVDIDALASLLSALSRWPLTDPRVGEVDLNPVICSPEGAWVVDATVIVDDEEPASGPEARIEPGRAELPPVDTFFEARSIGVVGASANPRKGGNIILRNLQRLGYRGRVVPVHPKRSEIASLEAFPSLSAIPGGVDMAVAVVPREQLEGVFRDAASSRTRHLVVATAGFADRGREGLEHQQRLLEQAESAKIRVMGPNSIGVINAHNGLATSFTTLHPLPKGRIGLFGQTGTFGSGYASWFSTRGRPGVSKIACIGNKGHTDEADLLGYFVRDERTGVIGMYTEGVENPELYDRLVELEGKKKVCVLRAGRNEAGREAVATHTGSMVGDDAVYRAAFRKTGVVEVDDIDELFLTLEALDRLPLPRSNRAAVVSITGIGCVLSAEAAFRHDIHLSQPTARTLAEINEWAPSWAPVKNPFDIWAIIEKHGAETAYSKTALAAASDPNVDALLLIFVLIDESSFDVGSLIGEISSRYPEKPILATVMGGGVDQTRVWLESVESSGGLAVPTPSAGFKLLSKLCAVAPRFHKSWRMVSRRAGST